jgi:hypothetical protein
LVSRQEELAAENTEDTEKFKRKKPIDSSLGGLCVLCGSLSKTALYLGK